jgi:hypothetical protein
MNAENADVRLSGRPRTGTGSSCGCASRRDGTARLTSPVFPLPPAHLANGVEDSGSVLPVREGAVEIPLTAHQLSTVRLKFR